MHVFKVAAVVLEHAGVIVLEDVLVLVEVVVPIHAKKIVEVIVVGLV